MVRGRASCGAHRRFAGARRAPPRRGRCRRTDRTCEPIDSARKHFASSPAISDSSDGTAALRQDPVDLPAPTGLIRYRVRVFKKYFVFKNSIPITNDSSWLLTSVPTPICLCKLFSCKACPGICRVQNPDIPRAGRVGAARGGAAGRGEARQDGTPN